MEEEEKVLLRLRVVKSKIKQPGGIVRVNSDILPDLHVEKGEDIALHYEDKTIIVKAVADPLIGKDEISIREPDMERLGVNEGDFVEVVAYERISEKLGELKEKIVKKLKKSDEEEGGEE